MPEASFYAIVESLTGRGALPENYKPCQHCRCSIWRDVAALLPVSQLLKLQVTLSSFSPRLFYLDLFMLQAYKTSKLFLVLFFWLLIIAWMPLILSSSMDIITFTLKVSPSSQSKNLWRRWPVQEMQKAEVGICRTKIARPWHNQCYIRESCLELYYTSHYMFEYWCLPSSI